MGRALGIIATCLLAAYSLVIAGSGAVVLGPVALAASLWLVVTAPWRLRTRVVTAVVVTAIAVLMFVAIVLALRDNLS